MNPNTIYIHPINASKVFISAEESILHELWDYFSFFAPNYRFIPKYKNGLWDGKIRLFNKSLRTLPTGLVGRLSKFASDNDYVIVDKRVPKTEETPTEAEIEAFMDGLNIHAGGKKIEYHDHQTEAIKHIITHDMSTILSSTSSGKSLVIYTLIRWYQEHTDGKILIIVPNTGLIHQMFSDFDDYASEDTWCSEDNVHKIYAGQEKQSDKKVYLSTWQSLQRMNEEYLSQFSVVFCDEVHTAEAKVLSGIMGRCTNAYTRAGFTGTLKSKTIHQLAIIGLFGDIRVVATNQTLAEKGIITPFKVNFVVLKYKGMICKEMCRKVVEKVMPNGKKKYRNNYRFETDFITQYNPRNIFILNLAKSLKGNYLILFDKVHKHGIPLYKMLKEAMPDRPIYYISGMTKANEREKIRRNMEKEENAILVASYGTLSTGVNIKNLDGAIFAYPYKSEIRVLQSVGRLLRKADGKNIAVLFDLVDDFRWKKSVNYLYKHFLKRYEIYHKERFPINVSEYHL
jgi:superfamily II DNA or RNA helicase